VVTSLPAVTTTSDLTRRRDHSRPCGGLNGSVKLDSTTASARCAEARREHRTTYRSSRSRRGDIVRELPAGVEDGNRQRIECSMSVASFSQSCVLFPHAARWSPTSVRLDQEYRSWGANNQLNGTVSINLGSGGKLSLGGHSDSVAGLNGIGSIDTGSTAGVGLTVTGAGANLMTGTERPMSPPSLKRPCGRPAKASNRGFGLMPLSRPAFPGSFREERELETARCSTRRSHRPRRVGSERVADSLEKTPHHLCFRVVRWCSSPMIDG